MTGSYSALSLCSKFHYNGNNLKEFIAVTCEPHKSHVTWWIMVTCLTASDLEISMAATAANINILQLIMFLFLKDPKVKQYCFSLIQYGTAVGTCTFLHRITKISVKLGKTILTLQRGVTSTARHSENITCRGVTSTARHAALSHSFDYISTTYGQNVIGLLCTWSQRSWLSYDVGDISYKLLLHFFLSSRSLGFLFAVPNFTGGFMGLWN